MKLDEYRFPLFIDLNGKRAVIIGGGNIALRRAHILQSFGAQVTMIAPECKEIPDGVQFMQRPYHSGDLSGAFLAVAATNDRAVNRQVGQDAVRAGIFVSVADRKEESTFYFPAICVGNGLVSGVVSQGEQHHKTAQAAREIRTVLEDME